MKKVAFAILLTSAAATAFAQAPAKQQQEKVVQAKLTLEQQAEAMTASFTKNLRLTPEQTKKVYVINLTSLQHAEAAKAKHKSNPGRLVRQMETISTTRLSQLKDVLTPQQFQQYQQRREEKMGVPKEAQSNPSTSQSARYQESY
ncbi:hypothetical protein [Pontibacter akesuensis]|uniref:LTXXQ motif family protein n=1 Tax=Pontibacter akesuensis TaxID=388950 RepID=A0A1I7KHZ7_9BACT|nr:hypothetical protein [Pontibacter akesuensis]GHA78901.1 hypothetical protein GCM10007389_36240 [Pontibacter akesuensis]SFU97032.1 hypothetical protein SAMN04487941_3764 [Pontibacter akesuensis]